MQGGSMRPEGPGPAFDADGTEPKYDLISAVTREGLRDYYVLFYGYRRKSLWAMRLVGFLMIPLSLIEYFFWLPFGLFWFQLALGAFIFALSFAMGDLYARSFLKAWDGPTEVRFRFFEEGFETYEFRGMTRRPYSDLVEIAAFRENLYLYVGRQRALLISRAALAGRLEEMIAFLERVTGKKVARVGRARLR